MKTIKFLSILCLLCLISACGTTSQGQNGSPDGNNGSGQVNTDVEDEIEDEVKEEQEEKDQTNENDVEVSEEELPEEKSTEDVNENQETEVDVDDQKIRILEKNISYTVNGIEKEETAFLRTSDNQDYSLYVLPEYTWTAEEPGRDVIYLNENGQHFMRIEILPEDMDLNHAIETAIEQLKAVDETVKEIDLKEQYPSLQNAVSYQADNGQEEVTAIIMPLDNKHLKLTIFTEINDDHTDPFIKMAETIVSN